MRLAFSLADEDGVNIGDREPDDMVLVVDMIVVVVEDVVEERKREERKWRVKKRIKRESFTCVGSVCFHSSSGWYFHFCLTSFILCCTF